MPFTQARGLTFHVQELGPREADPPVVMLHGLFSGSLASWWFTAAPAVSKRHRVRLLDLRGHGLSEVPPSGYDRASMLADVLELTADLPPFAVVGHSYGGLLGVALALEHPDRVRALAGVEVPLVAPEGTLADIDAEGIEAVVAREADGEEDGLAATTITADVAGDPPIGDADLARLDGAALFLFGRRSGYAAGADRVRRVLPHATCEVLDGGHNLHVDARSEVADRLVGFLGEVADGPEAVAYG